MEPRETATIVRLVKSVFPQQPIDATTYETWHLVIGHLDFTAAQAAVIAFAHSEKFCSASDIIREAERSRRLHPSARTAADAITAANRRELDAVPPSPPNEDFLAAKEVMLDRMRERDERAYLASREAERRAEAWISYKLSGILPPEVDQLAEPSPQWVQLSDDPPELRAWLVRKARAEESQ